MAVTISGSTGIDKVVDGSIAAVDLAANAVTTAKIADDAITLAKMAPGTDGNLITYDASQNPAYVATGTAGQLLTSAGAGAPPTFTTVSSGSFTTLGTVTVSGSPTSLTFSGINCSEHNFLVFMLSGLKSASTANPVFKLGSLDATTGDWMAGNLVTTNTTEGMIWLDTTTNRGMIYTSYNFPVVSAGNTGYGGSQPHTMLYSQGSNIQAQTNASIVWSLAGGVAFTAGSIKLYGVS